MQLTLQVAPMERPKATSLMRVKLIDPNLLTVVLSLVWLSIANGDDTYEKLQSGPMIGYATMAEVLIWVQTTGPSDVQINYWHKGDPSTRWKTEVISTKKETAFVAKCLANQVKSDSSYGYEVWIDGNKITPRFREGYKNGAAVPLEFSPPKNWRFREEGHRVFDFTIGFGSCAYINQDGGYDRLNNSNPYGAGYEIYERIYEKISRIFSKRVYIASNNIFRDIFLYFK